MNENSYLNPDTVKAECDEAINVFNCDNVSIQTIKTKLEEFTSDDEIKSDAFSTLKQQISDYMFVLQAFTNANNSDIGDYNTLKSSVGDEELVGAEILRQQREAIASRDSYNSKAQEYASKAGSAKHSWERAYYSGQAIRYAILAGKMDDLYKKYKEKEEKYDEIDTNTAMLFTSSANMRMTAKSALDDIKGAYKNGTYQPNLDADWRSGDEYNKIYIDMILNKDADDITEQEYSQIVVMLANCDNTDTSLLEYILNNKNCWEFVNVSDDVNTDLQLASNGCLRPSEKLLMLQALLKYEIQIDSLATTMDPDNKKLRDCVCKLSMFSGLIDSISANYNKLEWQYMLNSNQEEAMLDRIMSEGNYISLKYDEDGNLTAEIMEEFGPDTIVATPVEFSSDAIKNLLDTEHLYINRYLGIDLSDSGLDIASDMAKKVVEDKLKECAKKGVQYVGGEALKEIMSKASDAAGPVKFILEKSGEYAESMEKLDKMKDYEDIGNLSYLTDLMDLGASVSHYKELGGDQVPVVTFYPSTNKSGVTTQDNIDAFNKMMKNDPTYKEMAEYVIKEYDLSDKEKKILEGNLTMDNLLDYPDEMLEVLNDLYEVKKNVDDFSDYKNVGIEETMNKYYK